jgi:hypothetical protein
MTQKELDKAVERMRQETKDLKEGYESLRKRDPFPDGWNSPPALIPGGFELAMGVCYDPDWNTR